MNQLKIFKYPAGSVYETTLHYITDLMNVIPALKEHDSYWRKTILDCLKKEITVPRNYYQRILPNAKSFTNNMPALMIKHLYEFNNSIEKRPFVFIKNEQGHQAKEGLIPINTSVYEIDQSEINKAYTYHENVNVRKSWFHYWPNNINENTAEKCIADPTYYDDLIEDEDYDEQSFTYYQLSLLTQLEYTEPNSTVFVYLGR